MRQKTRSRLGKIAVLIASAILLVNFGSFIGRSMVRAADDDLTNIATFELVDMYKVVGNDHVTLIGSTPSSLEYGETLYAHLKWRFQDGVTVTPGAVYEYHLPTGITFSSMNGMLKNGNDNVGTYNINNTTITISYFDDGPDGPGTVFCAGNNRISELTFSGIIQKSDTGDQYVQSTDIAFAGGPDPVTINLTPPPNGTSLSVNKDNRTLISDSDHRYEYVANVISVGTNTNVLVRDWTTMGMYIDAATLGIYSDAACTVPYTGNYTLDWADADGFGYTIASMADGETIYFKYQVTIDNAMYDPATAAALVGDSNAYGPGGYKGHVNNTMTVISDTSPQKVDYNDIGTYSVYMDKFHERTDTANGTISWTIYLYGIPSSFSNGYIIDTLPDNSIYVDGSLYVNYWGDEHTSSVQVVPLGNGQIKFVLGDDILNYLKTVNNANCQITYSTKITEQHSASVVYTNSAELFYSGDRKDTAAANTAFQLPPVINKVGLYDDATAPDAFFTVSINPLALNLDTGDDVLTLVDQFPDTYDLQVASVSITRADGTAISSESYSYDEATKILTLNLEDRIPYTITYRATVNRRVGTQLDASNSTNTITLTDVATVSPGSYHFDCLVVRSAGSASSNNPDAAILNVIKHEEGDTTAVLQGAQFTLTAMNIGSSNTLTAGAAVVQTTNANGTTSFEVEREKIYMLTETLAPTGYELDENIYFYAFADTSSTIPSTVTYNGQTYTVTVIESDRASRDVYFADEAATVNIVDPTTPTTPTNPAVGGTTNNTTPTTTTEPTTGSSTPAATTAPAETTAAAEAVTASPTVPVSTGETDPNEVNGAGRGMATSESEEAAVTTATTTGAVTSTGESLSHARILGVLTIFVSFLFLILIRWERKEGMYEGNKYI